MSEGLNQNNPSTEGRQKEEALQLGLDESAKDESLQSSNNSQHENDNILVPSTNKEQPAEDFSQSQLIPEPGTVNKKSETENMEVHHHGHVHEQKKWKEYVFQFFMLFLAVFCGFLAEYQLEHVVEHNREEQYIKSFIEDLKTDTAKINEVIQTTKGRQHKMFDSLMGVIKKPGFLQNPEGVEKYYTSIFALNLFNHTDRTMQQLKNSGGLRLIRKQAASDSIMQYDNMVKLISEQGQDVYNANQKAIGSALQIFDANVGDNPMIDRSLVPKPDKINLISNDAYKVDELFNHVVNFKIASLIYCEMLSDLKEYARRQIILLKKEYHLK